MIPLTCFIVFGVAGVFLMLPPSGMRRRRVGIVLSSAALGFLGSLLPPLGSQVHQVVFLILATATATGGLATITSRNPVYCAIWFAMTLLTTAGLLLLQGAQFLGVATLVVYAGAILVTFLFVLMLAQPAGNFYDRISWGSIPTFFAALVGVMIVGGLTYIVTHERSGAGSTTREMMAADEDAAPARDARRQSQRRMASIGARLFTRHLVSVEVAGTLLLVALVGAVAIVIQGKQRSERRARGEESADGA